MAKLIKLFVCKDALKFSSAHMTIFGDGSKEPLHGHNYQVALSIEIDEEEATSVQVTFSSLKLMLKPLCKDLDEKILLPTRNPHVRILSSQTEIEVLVSKRRYVFPADEVCLLELENVTAELLAKYFVTKLKEALATDMAVQTWAPHVKGVEVQIFESAGQGAAYSYRRESE